MKKHELHNHPMTEERENIPPDKVIVDAKFAPLFSSYEKYFGHIIVSKEEYLKLKFTQCNRL